MIIRKVFSSIRRVIEQVSCRSPLSVPTATVVVNGNWKQTIYTSAKYEFPNNRFKNTIHQHAQHHKTQNKIH